MQQHVKGTTAAGQLARMQEDVAAAMAAIRAIGTSAEAVQAVKDLAAISSQLAATVTQYRAWLAADLIDSGQCRSLSQLAAELGISKPRAQQLVAAGRKRGNPVTDPGTHTEQPVVAVAIIIHPEGGGVLMEHRPDGDPPWTFPAAEIMPGESPAGALERRVPAETGVMIGVDKVIGSRIHPRNGRFMRYLAAHLRYPASAAEVASQPGDRDADKVEWVRSFAEVEQRAPDMFAPVRDLVSRELA